MTTTKGRVKCLLVNEAGSAFVGIRDDGTDMFEGFIISIPANSPPSLPDIPRVWISVLQEAFTNGNQVEITHDDEGARISALRVNKSPADGSVG
jgi:hypothetical protein